VNALDLAILECILVPLAASKKFRRYLANQPDLGNHDAWIGNHGISWLL
jgi:hypothetical protein